MTFDPIGKILGRKIVKDRYGRNKEVSVGDEYHGYCPACGAKGRENYQSGYGVGYLTCTNKKCADYGTSFYFDQQGKISGFTKNK
jgi:hypothetical protein